MWETQYCDVNIDEFVAGNLKICIVVSGISQTDGVVLWVSEVLTFYCGN